MSISGRRTVVEALQRNRGRPLPVLLCCELCGGEVATAQARLTQFGTLQLTEISPITCRIDNGLLYVYCCNTWEEPADLVEPFPEAGK